MLPSDIRNCLNPDDDRAINTPANRILSFCQLPHGISASRTSNPMRFCPIDHNITTANLGYSQMATSTFRMGALSPAENLQSGSVMHATVAAYGSGSSVMTDPTPIESRTTRAASADSWEASTPLAFDDVPKVLLQTRKRMKQLILDTHKQHTGIPTSQTEAIVASLQACLNVLKHEPQTRPTRYSSAPLVRILECIQESVATACTSDPAILYLLSCEAEKAQIDADTARGESGVWASRKVKPSDIGYSIYKSQQGNSSSVGAPPSWNSTFSKHIRTFRNEEELVPHGNSTSTTRDYPGVGADSKCFYDYGIHSHDLTPFSRAAFKEHLFPLASSLVLQTARTRALYRCWLHSFLELIRIRVACDKLRKAVNAAAALESSVMMGHATAQDWQRRFVTDANHCLDSVSRSLVEFPEVLGDLTKLESQINEESTAVSLLTALASTLGHISALMTYTPGHDLATDIETERLWIAQRVADILRRCICCVCRKELAAFVRKCCGALVCMKCQHRELTEGLRGDRDVGQCRAADCGIRQKLSQSRVWSLVPWMARVVRCCLTRVGFWTEERDASSRGPAPPHRSLHPPDPFLTSGGSSQYATNRSADGETAIAANVPAVSCPPRPCPGFLCPQPPHRPPTATSLTPSLLPDFDGGRLPAGVFVVTDEDPDRAALHRVRCTNGGNGFPQINSDNDTEGTLRFLSATFGSSAHSPTLPIPEVPASSVIASSNPWGPKNELLGEIDVCTVDRLHADWNRVQRERTATLNPRDGANWDSATESEAIRTKPDRLAQRVLNAAANPSLLQAAAIVGAAASSRPPGTSPSPDTATTTMGSDPFDPMGGNSADEAQLGDCDVSGGSQWFGTGTFHSTGQNRLASLKTAAFETDALVASLLERAFGDEW